MDNRPDQPSRRLAGPGMIAIGLVLAVIVVLLISANPEDTVVTPTSNGVTPTAPAATPQSTTVTPTTPPTTGPTQPAAPSTTPAAKPPQ